MFSILKKRFTNYFKHLIFNLLFVLTIFYTLKNVICNDRKRNLNYLKKCKKDYFTIKVLFFFNNKRVLLLKISDFYMIAINGKISLLNF